MGTNSKCSAKELNNSVSSTPVKSSAKQMKVQKDGESDVMKILSEINIKLNKLDNIEQHLAHVDVEMKDLKDSFTFVNDTTDELKEEQKKQNSSIKSLEETSSISSVACFSYFQNSVLYRPSCVPAISKTVLSGTLLSSPVQKLCFDLHVSHASSVTGLAFLLCFFFATNSCRAMVDARREGFLGDSEFLQQPSPSSIQTPEANDLEFWCKSQSWTYCGK
ncbi:hypothetical protein ACROYT_G013842 [Oculina patagonica]